MPQHNERRSTRSTTLAPEAARIAAMFPSDKTSASAVQRILTRYRRIDPDAKTINITVDSGSAEMVAPPSFARG